MSQSMFYPAVPAVSVDGDYNKNPLLRDLNVNDIGVVIPTTYVDARDGVRRSGFEVTVYDRKEIRHISYIYPLNAFATVDAFMAYVDSVVSTPWELLRKYTGWSKMNHYKPIYPTVNILVNEKKIRDKVYNPRTNTTDLHVDLGNTLQNEIFTVEGDAQLIAKIYYYTGSLS